MSGPSGRLGGRAAERYMVFARTWRPTSPLEHRGECRGRSDEEARASRAGELTGRGLAEMSLVPAYWAEKDPRGRETEVQV